MSFVGVGGFADLQVERTADVIRRLLELPGRATALAEAQIRRALKGWQINYMDRIWAWAGRESTGSNVEGEGTAGSSYVFHSNQCCPLAPYVLAHMPERRRCDSAWACPLPRTAAGQRESKHPKQPFSAFGL